MKNREVKGFLLLTFYFLLLTSYFSLFSCGYQLIGAGRLPFHSVTIMPVKNNTHEPNLEEKLHIALSKEFIARDIEVVAHGGDIELTATVTTFELSPIAAREEMVQEQAITMRADIRIVNKGRVIEFSSIESPMKITFQAVGSVREAAIEKEKAAEKACAEIAKELLSRLIIRYVK